MRLQGKVVAGPFGTGSKSEHSAVFLETAHGKLKLRRRGGNAFSDPELEALVGKTIRGEGQVVGSVLLLDGWSELSTDDG
jgi:hypothetical protein